MRTNAEKAAAYDAICRYALFGEEPDMNKLPCAVAAFFESAKPNLSASRRKAIGGSNGKPSKDSKKNLKSTDKDAVNEKENEIEIEIEIENENECITPSVSPSPAPTEVKPVRHKRGKYGWVMLTEEEYDRLVGEYGTAEVDRAISYIDESAQSTGNKNKWKDWNLTVRRCIRDGWGQRKETTQTVSQQMTGNPFAALRREVSG